MKRDIPTREVLDIGLALIPDNSKEHGVLWDVYLVNLKEQPIHNVLITVSGRSEDRSTSTSTVRYNIQEIAALSYQQIEVLMPEVSKITNQYWISFQHDNYMYDKKYIIPDDATEVEPDLIIPLICKLGIWFE